MTEATLIDSDLLTGLSAEARTSPRQRKNRNFHADNGAPAHRLLNAIEPGSYVPPHRHLDPTKDETMIVVRGRLGVVLFAVDGSVTRVFELASAGAAVGIDIPHGVYHSVVGLEPGTVFFEAKAGPYVPPTVDERAPWAPQEGEAAAGAYYEGLISRFA